MSHVRDGVVTREFAALMVLLAEAYPRVELREGTIRLYAQQLADLSLAEVRRAMDAAIRESDWFPTVAALRRQARPTGDDAALLAWTALCQAVEAVGAASSVEVEDGHAASALVAVFGSWPAFCAVPEGPELAIGRQAFLAAYRAARRSGPASPARLAGTCEASGAYPEGALAPRVWVAVLTAGGQVRAKRDTETRPPTLGTGQKALPDAAEA